VLVLTQTLSETQILNFASSSTVSLDNVLTYFINNETLGPDLCNYAPGIGAGPLAPSPVAPTLTRRSTILLWYPFDNPIKTLELRNPQFDDVEQLEFRRVNRLTRGATRKFFRDPAWPSAQRLIYSFDNLKEVKRSEYFDFLKLSLGKEIGLLDFESRQWYGILLTPQSPVQHEDRPGLNISFEFEGITGYAPLSTDMSNSSSVLTADLTSSTPLDSYGIFDGTTGYVNIDSAYIPDFSESFEVELTLRGPGGIQGDYWFAWGNSSVVATMFGLATGTAGNESKARIFFRNDASVTLLVTPLTTDDVFDGTDHVVKVTWNGTDTIAMYVDDVLNFSESIIAALGTVTLNRCTMGALGRTSTTNNVEGRIYKCTITANAVPLHRYLYTEGSGGTVGDSIGVADGAIVGGVTWGS